MAERNVLNVEEIRAYAAAAAESAAEPVVAEWVRQVLPRFVIRSYDSVLEVVTRQPDGAVMLRDAAAGQGAEPRPYRGDVPGWCRQALDAGRNVLFVRLDGPLHKRVRRTIAYLDAHPQRATPRVSFAQAEAWGRQARSSRRAQRRAEIAAEGVPVFRHGDATVVQLTSPAALEAEGRRMFNCLAQYGEIVRSGQAEIYSLRDRAGKSHAVLEVDREGYVLQIKGPQNGNVQIAWRRAVRAFIAARGYGVANDIWSLSRTAAALTVAWEHEGEAALLSPEGRAGMRALRHVGIDAAGAAEAMQLTMLLDWTRNQRSPRFRRAVFDALAPVGEAPFRERPVGTQRIYDVEVTTTAVEVPLPFLNLARLDYFKPLRPEQQAAGRLLARAQQALAALAFRSPEHIFLLGPHAAARGYMPHWASAADVLVGAAVDIRAARQAKHRALRERLNRANRRLRGPRAQPTGAHLALRWLLDGGTGQFVV